MQHQVGKDLALPVLLFYLREIMLQVLILPSVQAIVHTLVGLPMGSRIPKLHLMAHVQVGLLELEKQFPVVLPLGPHDGVSAVASEGEVHLLLALVLEYVGVLLLYEAFVFCTRLPIAFVA